MPTHKTGLLLINLGTPDAPDTTSVRRYLKEFLLDPYVITLPTIARYLLVYGLILPFRPKQSAHAYQQIWTSEGSPLLTNSQELKNALQTHLGDTFEVALGMRYGNPSIEKAINTLTNASVDKIIVLPLFPQYADATNLSALEKTKKILKQKKIASTAHFIEDFYTHPAYIDPFAKIIQSLMPADTEFLLFSYHGLPERALPITQCPHKSPCQDDIPCPINSDQYTSCYRAQCFTTSELMAKKLSLAKDKYATTFQSRLGRTKWIGPYTDEYLSSLREKGIKNLTVACPSFVSDCLETLEEIGIRLKEDWQKCGGDAFTLIPCLNADALWVEKLAQWVKSF